MAATTTPATASLPALPHWETTPADLKAAVREVKAALRARIAASGRTVEEVFAVIEARVRDAGRGDRRREGARRDDLAGHRLRRHRGRHRPGRRAREAAPARLPRGTGALPARAGAGVGRRHRRLRRVQPVLRELPRPRRRLLRQRRLQARDLPGLLVARADAGPAERPDGDRAEPAQPPVALRVRRGRAGSTPTATPSTRTASAAVRKARTPAASAPTWTQGLSTCG